jgi:hypothetical protein
MKLVFQRLLLGLVQIGISTSVAAAKQYAVDGIGSREKVSNETEVSGNIWSKIRMVDELQSK